MNYEVIRPLGRGGMGEVYLARDLRLDRRVAIKTLRSDLQGGVLQEQLQHEAQVLAQLNHPNIVQIFDLIDHQGQLALVMEYVEGMNLHIALREGRGDTGDLLRWLAEVAAGLACAHRAGIAHRDLKAENVLIAVDGVAKVTDFGIAEAAAGAADRQEDVAALGRLALHLLGDAPTQAPTLRYLIEQLLHKSPGRRPSAAEAAESFRLAWHESTQEDTAPPEPAAPPGRRLQAMVALVMTFAMLAAGLFWWWEQRSIPRRHVAVLTPEFRATGGVPQSQQLALQATVQQALQQGVIDSPQLHLVSVRETAAVAGTAGEIAAALAADEVLASTLHCIGDSCELTIERLASDGAVISSRHTTLLPDAALESWNVVRGQWPRLYTGAVVASELGELIDEDDYREYLQLYRESFLQAATSEDEIFRRAEQLIGRADRFLPLYRLYIDSAMDLYDDTSDAAYLQRAEQVLDNASAWAGNSLLLHQARFEVALEGGDFATAGDEIAALTALGADRVLLHTLNANFHSRQGEFETAAGHFDKAMALRPSRSLYYNSAWNLYEWGRPEAAAELLARSLAVYPNDGPAHDMLGMIRLLEGDMDNAIGHFEAALQLENTMGSHSNLGLAFLLRGDYREARRQFLEVYENGGREPVTLLNLADSETLLGNRETAAAVYRELIDDQLQARVESDPRALSQAYAQLGMYDKAIATLKQGQGLRKRNSEDSFNAALVYTLSGQYIAALVEVEQALTSGFSPIWFSLPFFDPLCADPAFGEMLGRAGSDDHCRRGSGSIRLD